MEVADEGVRGSPVEPPEPADVVAVTVADFADSPASFVAATWKPYAVEGVRPPTVADVPVAVWTLAPSR